MYQRIWTHHVGEYATTVRNEHDQFTVAVFEDETLCTVGHLLWEIYFLIMHHIYNVVSWFMLSEVLFNHTNNYFLSDA